MEKSQWGRHGRSQIGWFEEDHDVRRREDIAVKSRTSIPDGWLDFSPYYKPIQNTRIIATKSPMKKEFGLESAKEFTPTLLVEKLHQDGYTLGHVIDLTFTDRYYSPQEFRHHGVSHEKVKVPGKDIPGDKIFARFSEALNNFLGDKTKDGPLVAVHCTHGINRTGYLICRYLIEKHGMTVESSIDAFNEARGHSMENKEYLEDLERKYSSTKKSSPPQISASPSQSEGHDPSAYSLLATQHHGDHKEHHGVNKEHHGIHKIQHHGIHKNHHEKVKKLKAFEELMMKKP